MIFSGLQDTERIRRFGLLVLATALAYAVAGQLGHYLESRFDAMSVVWLAAGVSTAAAVRFGLAGVAGVFLGAFAANWGHVSHVLLPYLALGEALGAAIIFWIVGRSGRELSFGSVSDIGRFCLLAIPAGTVVSAFVATAARIKFDFLPQEQLLLALWSSWSPSLAGAILLGPVLLAANPYDWRPQRNVFRMEWAAVAAASLLVIWLMTGTDKQQAWKIGESLLFPLVLWVALRFSAGATTLLVLVVSLVRIASDLDGLGRVELHAPPFLELLNVQVTTLSLAISGMLVAAALTERRESEMRLDRLANHDLLTGLPNRTYFQVYLEHAVAQCARKGGQVSLLFIDLDRFKHINDSRGHEVGDEVLRIIADRLGAVLRGDDFVARLGGDEFAVVMSHPKTLRAASRVAQKVIETLSEPFKVGNHTYTISASIGISVYPDDASDTNTLLRQADMAMYKAKLRRSGFEYFSEDMNAAAHEQLVIENGIRRALRNDDFALLYQPKIDLATGRMVGMEALIRWMTPGGTGIVGPDKFIPVAEDTGLIVPLGHWVLRTACRQWVAWREAGLNPPLVSVNLSPRQFSHGGLAREILLAIEDTGMNPAYLGLEITESTAMDNPKTTMQVLAEMSQHGIQVMIDDFGTGHSNLRQLKRLPIDIVKIDKSFVRDVLIDKEDAEIANAIVRLAHLLDLRVVAEGVESMEVAAFLKEIGCDEIQGYLVGKPMPPDAVKDQFGKSFIFGGAQEEIRFGNTDLIAESPR